MEFIKELNGITLPEDFKIKYINENEFNERDLIRAIELYEKDKRENSYKELKFTIYSEPKASSRPRVMKTHTYDPSTKYKQEIRIEVYRQLEELGYTNFTPITGELYLYLDVYRPISKSTPKYKRILAEAGVLPVLCKPDVDNYIKLVSDALNNILFKDDSQIIDERIRKFYSNTPRYEFTIRYKELNIF